LEHLDPLPWPILSDESGVVYIPFLNNIVEVKKNGITTINYKELKSHVVWKDQIIKREFNGMRNFHDSVFNVFMKNIANNDETRLNGFKSALGYLMHCHSSPSKGQAVILYDQAITNIKRPQGGTGKGIIAQALGQIRKVTKIDGKNYKSEDRFKFQQAELSTQIMSVDDPNANFDFTSLFSDLTDGLQIQKKHQQSIAFEREKSPKFLIPSNTILQAEGSSEKRRQYVLELSDHYSKQIINGDEEPIMTEHGCVFFDKDDWSEDEWSMFYAFMIDCVLYYLRNGLVNVKPLNVATNRLLQITSEEFVEWTNSQNFRPNILYNTNELFLDFRNTYLGEDSNFKQRSFSKQLKEYASIRGWNHSVKRSNGTQQFQFTVA
jgi:hypothetical protein